MLTYCLFTVLVYSIVLIAIASEEHLDFYITVLTTLYFLDNLRMGPIIKSVCSCWLFQVSLMFVGEVSSLP